MLDSPIRRTIGQAIRSIKAARYGWRWERDDRAHFVPLADRRWSTAGGGEIWRRWDGEDYEYRQEHAEKGPPFCLTTWWEKTKARHLAHVEPRDAGAADREVELETVLRRGKPSAGSARGGNAAARPVDASLVELVGEDERGTDATSEADRIETEAWPADANVTSLDGRRSQRRSQG